MWAWRAREREREREMKNVTMWHFNFSCRIHESARSFDSLLSYSLSLSLFQCVCVCVCIFIVFLSCLILDFDTNTHIFLSAIAVVATVAILIILYVNFHKVQSIWIFRARADARSIDYLDCACNCVNERHLPLTVSMRMCECVRFVGIPIARQQF